MVAGVSIFKMHTLSAVFFALCAFMGALATPVPDDQPAPAHPPWEQVYIKAFDYTGDACPPGSVTAYFNNSEVESYFEVAFDEMVIQAHPDQPSVDTRNCSLSFNLQFPAGWSFALITLDVLGNFDDNVRVRFRDSCYWDNYPGSWLFAYIWGGSGNTPEFSPGEDSPPPPDNSCQGAPGALKIDSRTTVEVSQNTGDFVPISAKSGKVIHQYGVEWTTC